MPKIIYYTRHYVNRLAIEAENMGNDELKANMLLELKEINERSIKGEIKIVESFPERRQKKIDKTGSVRLWHVETGQTHYFEKIIEASWFLEISVYMVAKYATTGELFKGYEIEIKRNK